MSHFVDEQYAVYDERRRRAAKEHGCSACKETIRRGDYYMHVGTVADGSASTVKRCLRCQEIHEHLRGLDMSGEVWPDELLNCGEEYRQHWGEDPPDEIAALAFVSADEMQRRAPNA